jgi:Restriction endonuclease
MTASLFKWHASSFHQHTGSSPHSLKHFSPPCCDWCHSPLQEITVERPSTPSVDSFYDYLRRQCPCCGWWSNLTGWYNISVHQGGIDGSISTLRQFSIDSPEVTLEELGTYLKQHFSDAYNLPWRRFEELVQDVFKQRGFHTRLTQATRDDGADVILLDDGGNKNAIVQVKRFGEDRRVGIGLVRELIGAQLLHGVHISYLVTSSTFTQDALKGADSAKAGAGLIVNLWDAVRLLKELDCYNEAILPAQSIETNLPLYQQIIRARQRSQ